MPNQADITVKKADGTTDITYAKVVPSSGSNSPAIWRSPVGAAAGHKATLSTRASANASNTVRRVVKEYVFPETATGADGKVTVVNRARMRLETITPLDMLDTLVAEFTHQGLNLFDAPLGKLEVIEGYAAT